MLDLRYHFAIPKPKHHSDNVVSIPVLCLLSNTHVNDYKTYFADGLEKVDAYYKTHDFKSYRQYIMQAQDMVCLEQQTEGVYSRMCP